MPTDLPLPTACIRIARKTPLTTGANGQLFVNYIPGALLRSYDGVGGMISTLATNTTCNFSGTSGTTYYLPNPALGLPQTYDAWRLVAAEMHLEYVGTVLNQAGRMIACAHYETLEYA